MFARYFGPKRRPHTLSRRDWDRFVVDRRAGRVAPGKAKTRRVVGDRVIAYDLKFIATRHPELTPTDASRLKTAIPLST